MATPVVNKVLIIGGGFSGMAAAIELRKQDIEVDVVEIDPGWRSYGAGISLGGATLRAFRRLGILESLLEHGAASDGVEIFIPPGQKVAELPTPRIAGPDVPGNGGIMRPVLARILADATRASGASVRLGGTVTQGVIDFPRIFDHANVAGMKHYYVEHDFPHDPIASITTSFQYLRRMFNSH
jgi:2-polyprenyl-6-methoxyphenol hydroxylase-like FAD-dependent oxidoreductase